jgi:hypothetical protein
LAGGVAVGGAVALVLRALAGCSVASRGEGKARWRDEIGRLGVRREKKGYAFEN